MAKIKLFDGTTYAIKDYATENSCEIILNGVSFSDVIEKLSERNLSKIHFLTDNDAVTGTYENKLLCGYTDNGDTLAVEINDADLCRYGLILDENNRIVDVPAQRYAPAGAIIVDVLPEGYYYDYLYIDGEYVYDPLPRPEPVPETDHETRIAALEEELAAAKILLGVE